MNPADQDLIVRVLRHDDRDAFGELVLSHQSAVRRFLANLTSGDQAWADDLAQESFIFAYRHLASFRGESSFLTWVFGIAHNQFRNSRRKRGPEIPREGRRPAGEVEASEPAAVRTADLREDLDRALDRLSSDERAALHLCYQKDLSHREAATVLGWPVGTVKTHLARGKEKLKLLLKPWNPSA